MNFKKLPTREFVEILKSAYDRKDGTDVVISTEDGFKLEAHQCILAISPLILKLLQSSEIKCLPKPVIVLPGFKSRSIKTLLKFLYTGQILLEKSNIVTTEFQELCFLLNIDPNVTRSKPDKNVRCEYCCKRFESREFLKSHTQREHRNERPAVAKSRREEKEERSRRDKEKRSKNRSSEKLKDSDKALKKDEHRSRHKSSKETGVEKSSAINAEKIRNVSEEQEQQEVSVSSTTQASPSDSAADSAAKSLDEAPVISALTAAETPKNSNEVSETPTDIARFIEETESSVRPEGVELEAESHEAEDHAHKSGQEESNRVHLFGLPDNFDFSDDFIREIKSRDRGAPEPNETVNDDPEIRGSMILESPLPVGFKGNQDAETDENLFGDHSKKTIVRKSSHQPNTQQLNKKYLNLQQEIEAKRLRTMSKMRTQEIEKFDENFDKRKHQNLINLKSGSSRSRHDSRKRKSSKVSRRDDKNAEKFIVYTDESALSDSSWIEEDLSSSFEEDKEWNVGKEEQRKRRDSKKREEEKKRRQELKRKFDSERASVSSDEDDGEETEIVKVWPKRGAKLSARPHAPKLRVRVCNNVPAMMDMNQYRLHLLHGSSSSEDEKKIAENSKEQRTKRMEELVEKVRAKKSKRISRILSSSSGSDEEPEQRHKESDSEDTSNEEKRKREKKRKRKEETEKKKDKKKRKKDKKEIQVSESSEEEKVEDPKKLKRSQSLDTLKRPMQFNRQHSSLATLSKEVQESFKYSYGLSTENKLLAEKRAKAPDEIEKIMKMKIKKKSPTHLESKSPDAGPKPTIGKTSTTPSPPKPQIQRTWSQPMPSTSLGLLGPPPNPKGIHCIPRRGGFFPPGDSFKNKSSGFGFGMGIPSSSSGSGNSSQPSHAPSKF